MDGFFEQCAFFSEMNHNTTPNGNNINSGGKTQNSLADQWAAYSAMQQPQAAHSGGSQEQMQQLYMQQQWIYQQMINSYQQNGVPNYPQPTISTGLQSYGQTSTGYSTSTTSYNNSKPYSNMQPRDRNRSHPYTHSPNLRRQDRFSSNIPLPPNPPPPPPPAFRCENCKKDFANQVVYQAHVSAHKQCPFCTYAALSKQLAEHMATEHGDEDDIPEPSVLYLIFPLILVKSL